MAGLMPYLRMPGHDVAQNRKWRATVDEDGHYCFAMPR